MVDEVLAYQVLCGFAARLFEESPQEDLVEQLIEQRSYLLEPPFSSVAQAASKDLSEYLGSEDFALQEVNQDYTYLFYMVGVSHTSPYESVYRTDDKTLFGPTTLEVREAYRAFEVKVEKEGSTPDDHIGYELSFLAHLLNLAAQAHEVSNAEQVEKITESIRAFLSEHLLVFAPIYLKNVRTQAQTPFYRALAEITLCTIESMAKTFGATATETIEESVYLLQK